MKYTDDVNTAYNSFMKILVGLQDKNCNLIKLGNSIRKNAVNKPWMTNGITNDCKKKKECF